MHGTDRRFHPKFTEFARAHRKELSRLIGSPDPAPLSDEEMAIVLGNLVGHVADAHMEKYGHINHSLMIQTIRQMPREAVSPVRAMKALQAYDDGMSYGEPVDRAHRLGPHHLAGDRPLSLRATREAMYRRLFPELLVAHQDLARAIIAFADCIPASKTRSGARDLAKAAGEIRRQTQRCEWRARTAASAAVRAGRPVEGVARAVVRLHLRRLGKLLHVAESVERLANLPTDGHISDGIRKSRSRTYQEIARLNAGPELLHPGQARHTRRHAPSP